jgi:glycosyltransferase involved in cell wall biosynthesis
MRIAFIAQPFDRMDPPVRGGSLAIWIYQVAQRCAARGHETFVIANHGGVLSTRRTTYENVKYVFTPTGFNGLLNRTGEAASNLLARAGVATSDVPTFAAPWRDAGYAFEAARALRTLKADAGLVMNYSQIVPMIRKVSPSTKIYLYMQCEWLTQLDRQVMGRRIELTDRVGGCSEYITRLIANRFPEHKAKCVTLNNAGLPPDQSGDIKRDPRHVLFVGRVSPEKGVHVLVDAFHEVLKQVPDAHLHLVGGIGSAPLEFLVGLSDDPHVADLRRFYEPINGSGQDPYLGHLERAAGSELGKRIIFEGRVDHDQTAAAYRRTAVLVNPSLSESFGMSLVEAMMYGVPVVAASVGGMTYIVKEGETGHLVDANDSRALASAICRLLQDESRARSMGEAGRRRALEHFSWDRTAETLLDQVGANRG